MTPGAADDAALRRACRALMFGNMAIGCGVMAPTGTLNDLSRSLDVGIAVAGQVITASAVAMAVGAPMLAAWVAGIDRRRLLTLTLLWFGAGHALCAVVPDFATLLPVRAATVLGAAVFTPQAAAAIAVMAPAERRGWAMSRVFLGWSFASVAGMPASAWLAERLGWRYAFAAVALMSVAAALWAWRATPDGVRPSALSRADWGRALTRPVLIGAVAVTALSASGQFSLFAYFAPYYRQVLSAGPEQVGLLFLWFGAFGLLGNVGLARVIDRVGAARAVAWLLAAMGLSMLAWPLAGSVAAMAAVLTPWALGCFASNSAQQARLAQAAPALAPALIALNSSAMYVGQALGASGGGAAYAHWGFAPLSWIALAWMTAAVATSLWVEHRAWQESRGGR